MNIKLRILFTLLPGLLALSSCSSKKDVVYLADMQPAFEYTSISDKETMVQPNDLLSIVVSCKRPELAVPFNTRNNSVKISDEGNVSTYTGDLGSDPVYRVDKRGNITFPILGTIHVAGYRLSQVAEIVKELIVEGDYIKDPHVAVDLVNFKYTVLGAVGRTGTFNADGDRVTLLEAIAQAGDISANGRSNNVKVIREVDGKRMVLTHDLNSREIFESPFFYLKPNDIVYVEPRYKNKDNENRGWQITTLVVSIASVASTLIWALKK